MRSYLGATCHFIANFKIHSVMLACRHFVGSHTGEAIVSNFEEIVDSFDLTGKVLYVVTNNATNMKRAFHLLTDTTDHDHDHEADTDFEDGEVIPVELGI